MERWDCTEKIADDRNPDNDEAQVIVNPDAASATGPTGWIKRSAAALVGGLMLIVLAVGGWRYRRTRRPAGQP